MQYFTCPIGGQYTAKGVGECLHDTAKGQHRPGLLRALILARRIGNGNLPCPAAGIHSGGNARTPGKLCTLAQNAHNLV